MNGDVKLGQILCDEDIITKRQLNQALQVQIKGDKRTLGEILIDKGFCSLEDVTSAIMNQGGGQNIDVQESPTKVEKEIKPKKKEAKELSEDTKFSMSVGTMIGIGSGIASIVGLYYMLIGEIEEAKNLPSLETLYQAEYPSRPEGYNWPRSYEQYKTQVGQLQNDMDDVLDVLEEYEETIDELEKQVTNLRVKVGSK